MSHSTGIDALAGIRYASAVIKSARDKKHNNFLPKPARISGNKVKLRRRRIEPTIESIDEIRTMSLPVS
jgi:hypothetical protein